MDSYQVNGIRVNRFTLAWPTLEGDTSELVGQMLGRSVSNGRSDERQIKGMKEIEEVLIRVL